MWTESVCVGVKAHFRKRDCGRGVGSGTSFGGGKSGARRRRGLTVRSPLTGPKGGGKWGFPDSSSISPESLLIWVTLWTIRWSCGLSSPDPVAMVELADIDTRSRRRINFQGTRTTRSK